MTYGPLPSGDLPRLIDEEYAREAARAHNHRREADRFRGVAWSGFAPEPRASRPGGALRDEATRRLDRLQAWRDSVRGRFLAAVARAQRAAAQAHLEGEAARAALSRGLDSEQALCTAAAAAMEAQGQALLAAARTARRVLNTPPSL